MTQPRQDDATPRKRSSTKTASARKTARRASGAETRSRRAATRVASPDEKLKVYRAKRHFGVTPEPAGRPAASSTSGNSYLIQKHAASRLHYDFRLELDGVLLSWAVPKGPSLHPDQRRLAVRTEDHPIEYGEFEGVIPKGEYGGGSVMLWDRGTWDPEGDPRESLKKGHLTITLHGERLRGRWHLVRTRRPPSARDRSDGWLLFKGKDVEALEGPGKELVDTELTSVTTGRTMEEIAEQRDRTWSSNRSEDENAATPAAARRRARSAPRRDSAEPAQSGATAGLAKLVAQIPTTVRFSNLDKVLYPEQGLTKAALIAYYAVVGEHILPHLAGRPLTLVRCPNGPSRHCFYQKHAKDGVQDAIRRIPIQEDDGMALDYMAVDDRDGLFAAVQLGALELHTWGCHSDNVERPDQLVMDLDPDEGLGWSLVVDAAFELRELLRDLGLRSWVKTTGGKGLHVCVPTVRRMDWEEFKVFARALASSLADAAPDRYTINPMKARRKGRLFVDYLRNGRGATAIAPYSTRARATATVATPISWEELKAGVDPDSFTVRTLPARLDALKKDPWADFLTSPQSVTVAMRKRLGVAA